MAIIQFRVINLRRLYDELIQIINNLNNRIHH